MDQELETKNLHETDLTKPKSFRFAVGEEEFLRLEEGGNVYVKGSLVTEDLDCFEGFKVWLQAAQEFTRRQFEESVAQERNA